MTQNGGHKQQRPEPLSDDFLFSMSSSTENRLSYASSPESDLEVSPPPAPRLVKSSSDPSIATTQDNMDRDDDINHLADAVPPPYTQGGYGDSKYGFSANGNGTNGGMGNQAHMIPNSNDAPPYQCGPMTHSPPHSPLYGTVPELPPRGPSGRPTGGVLLPAPPPTRPPHNLRHNTPNRPSAQERLFGPPKESSGDDSATYTARPTSMVIQQTQGSLDRHRHGSNPQSSYDGTTYEYSASNTGSSLGSCRLPPNAPDDLKVAPPGKMEPPPPPNPTAMSAQSPQRNSNSHEHPSLDYRGPENNYRSVEGYRGGRPTNGGSPHAQQPSQHQIYQQHPQQIQQHQQQHPQQHQQQMQQPQQQQHTPMHARGPSLPSVPTNDHAKYSARTNSASQADYQRGPAYKPVPPPKPKHYRPPDALHHARNGSMEPAGPTGQPARAAAPPYSHAHSLSQPHQHAHQPPLPQLPHQPHQQHQPHQPHQHQQHQQHRPHAHPNYQQGMYGAQMAPQSPPYSGPPPHHRAINLPHNPQLIDLAGSREQRGSAFELYRKPQHMHNLR